jgi:hypothetical protein
MMSWLRLMASSVALWEGKCVGVNRSLSGVSVYLPTRDVQTSNHVSTHPTGRHHMACTRHRLDEGSLTWSS